MAIPTDLIKTSKDQIQAATKYIPRNESPRAYLELVQKQIMGTDKKGRARPFQDLLLFLYVCNKTGLDPLTKQIYPIYFWNYKTGKEEMSIVAGIDGLRLIAERTGAYGGQEDIQFDPENGEHPEKATAAVHKLIDGKKLTTKATARWSEYAKTNKEGKAIGMWKQMPYLMLGKTAEALALRKAFPNDMSGIYIPEEMQQAQQSEQEALETPEKFATSQKKEEAEKKPEKAKTNKQMMDKLKEKREQAKQLNINGEEGGDRK